MTARKVTAFDLFIQWCLNHAKQTTTKTALGDLISIDVLAGSGFGVMGYRDDPDPTNYQIIIFNTPMS